MTKSDECFHLSDKQIADATARALSRFTIPKGIDHLPEMNEEERERMEKHLARFRRVFQNAQKDFQGG